MRLQRVGPAGWERPAGLDADGVLRDLSSLVPDIDGPLLASPGLLAAVERALASGRLPVLPSDCRIGPPVARPGKLIGIGLNYRDHADEAGVPIPEAPVVFLKPSSGIVGPYDDIVVPVGSTTTDYEVELGVVVGRHLRDCADETAALAAVGGYVAVNDVTERSLVAAGPTWAKGKCHDSFTPMGPWLLTADEVADPQRLALALRVDGVVRQSSSTEQMAVGVAGLLCYLSTLMALEPGDVVLTGTPAGVASGSGQPYLTAGALVELEVDGLGSQRCRVRAAQVEQSERVGGPVRRRGEQTGVKVR